MLLSRLLLLLLIFSVSGGDGDAVGQAQLSGQGRCYAAISGTRRVGGGGYERLLRGSEHVSPQGVRLQELRLVCQGQGLLERRGERVGRRASEAERGV